MVRVRAARMSAIVEAVFQRQLAYSCPATEGNPLFVAVSGMLCVGKACMPASVRFPVGPHPRIQNWYRSPATNCRPSPGTTARLPHDAR